MQKCLLTLISGKELIEDGLSNDQAIIGMLADLVCGIMSWYQINPSMTGLCSPLMLTQLKCIFTLNRVTFTTWDFNGYLRRTLKGTLRRTLRGTSRGLQEGV